MAKPAATNRTLQLVIHFNDAFNAHDVDGMMRLMSDDSVFENTQPAPDGTRYEGREAVGAFWRAFFQAARGQSIEIEEIFALNSRCVMRWTYRWLDAEGRARHVRGVDVFRVKRGRIAEKLSYVKG